MLHLTIVYKDKIKPFIAVTNIKALTIEVDSIKFA